MDHVVLGIGVGDQPVDDPYVSTFSPTFKRASELVSSFASSVGFPHLAGRQDGHEVAWPPKVPTAADPAHPHGCRRHLHPHPSRGADLFRKPNQRPIRDSRHGETAREGE